LSLRFTQEWIVATDQKGGIGALGEMRRLAWWNINIGNLGICRKFSGKFLGGAEGLTAKAQWREGSRRLLRVTLRLSDFAVKFEIKKTSSI
jgi:hypothetical protein